MVFSKISQDWPGIRYINVYQDVSDKSNPDNENQTTLTAMLSSRAGEDWKLESLNGCFDFDSEELRQIADKLDQLNGI